MFSVKIERFIGPCGKVPIVIRDDDTNFFTKTHMLESIYSKAWNDGFKVSLSVVPLQETLDDIIVPPNMRKTELRYRISDNEGLVKFLRKKVEDKSVEILQHGFFHKTSLNGRGEFSHSTRKANIESGRNILKRAFEEEPRFFVPPYDDISKRNLELVLKLGMVPIYRQTNFDRFLRSVFIPQFVKFPVFKEVMKKYRNLPYLPRPMYMNIDDSGIFWSLPEREFGRLKTYESLLDLVSVIIKRCSISRMPICILNHYHTYFYDWCNEVSKDDLFKTWKLVLESFANLTYGWRTNFSDLYDRARKIQKIQLLKTGSKITIESKQHIEDFSFRVYGQFDHDPDVTIDEETNIATIKQLIPQSKVIFYER